MITITTTAVLNKEHAIYLLTCKRFKLVHTFHGQNNHGLGLTKPCAQYSLQSCFPLFSILDCGFVTKITNARSVPHHAKNPYSVTHYLLDLTTFCNNCAILLCQWLCKFACAHIFSELHWIQTKSSFFSIAFSAYVTTEILFWSSICLSHMKAYVKITESLSTLSTLRIFCWLVKACLVNLGWLFS